MLKRLSEIGNYETARAEEDVVKFVWKFEIVRCL